MGKIGHASIDERSKASGGQAGDQNNKEVCIRDWYNKPWGYVLRPKDTAIAEKMASACEKGCANPAVGYDQSQRNTLKTQAVACGMDLSKITTPCECDCSSFMTVCAECAGVKIPYSGSNAPTTSTMQSAFMSTGQFDYLTDSKYLTSDKYLKRGDVLVAPGSHTVMSLENGSGVKSTQTSTSNKKAIDISQYNTITDYKLLAQQFKYIFIRIGYRSYEKGILTEDKSFKTHIKNCLANGMNVGIYFYDQSLNETEAEEQAVWVANMLKDYTITLPVFIDSEYSNNNHNGRADSISKGQRTKNVVAFCNKIKALGYTPGVYSGNSWFTSMLDFNKLSNYIIWCARYSTQKPTVPRYDIWQYGSEYYNWATKNIDTNIIYTDLKIKEATKNTNSKSASKPTSTPTPSGLTTEKPILLVGQVNITEGSLNVRKSPSTDAPIVAQLQKGQYIQLRGDLGTWYRMDLGYVSKQYIKEVHGIVTGDKLNVRSTPNSSLTTNIITTIPKGTEVIVCAATTGWFNILLSDGTMGWVSEQYLKLK